MHCTHFHKHHLPLLLVFSSSSSSSLAVKTCDTGCQPPSLPPSLPSPKDGSWQLPATAYAARAYVSAYTKRFAGCLHGGSYLIHISVAAVSLSDLEVARDREERGKELFVDRTAVTFHYEPNKKRKTSFAGTSVSSPNIGPLLASFKSPKETAGTMNYRKMR